MRVRGEVERLKRALPAVANEGACCAVPIIQARGVYEPDAVTPLDPPYCSVCRRKHWHPRQLIVEITVVEPRSADAPGGKAIQVIREAS